MASKRVLFVFESDTPSRVGTARKPEIQFRQNHHRTQDHDLVKIPKLQPCLPRTSLRVMLYLTIARQLPSRHSSTSAIYSARANYSPPFPLARNIERNKIAVTTASYLFIRTPQKAKQETLVCQHKRTLDRRR